MPVVHTSVATNNNVAIYNNFFLPLVVAAAVYCRHILVHSRQVARPFLFADCLLLTALHLLHMQNRSKTLWTASSLSLALRPNGQTTPRQQQADTFVIILFAAAHVVDVVVVVVAGVGVAVRYAQHFSLDGRWFTSNCAPPLPPTTKYFTLFAIAFFSSMIYLLSFISFLIFLPEQVPSALVFLNVRWLFVCVCVFAVSMPCGRRQQGNCYGLGLSFIYINVDPWKLSQLRENYKRFLWQI